MCKVDDDDDDDDNDDDDDDDLVFNISFKIIQDVWEGDNERLCAMKCHMVMS